MATGLVASQQKSRTTLPALKVCVCSAIVPPLVQTCLDILCLLRSIISEAETWWIMGCYGPKIPEVELKVAEFQLENVLETDDKVLQAGFCKDAASKLSEVKELIDNVEFKKKVATAYKVLSILQKHSGQTKESVTSSDIATELKYAILATQMHIVFVI